MGSLDTNSVYMKLRNNILPTWLSGWTDTRKVTWKGAASLCLHFVCRLHRLCGPQNRYECCGQQEYLLPSPGFEPWTFQPRALLRQSLRYSGSHHVLYVAHESNSRIRSHFSPCGTCCEQRDSGIGFSTHNSSSFSSFNQCSVFIQLSILRSLTVAVT